MKPLDPQSRQLLDEVSSGDVPPADLEARLWQTLAPRLNEALPPTAAAASQALGANSGLLATASPLLKLLVGAVMVGTVATGSILYLRPNAADPRQPRAVSLAPAAPQPQPSAPANAPAPQVEPQGSTLAAETQLLARAQRALRGGDPGSALPWIERHGALFPRGELAQEREAARIFALCALQRTVEARRAQQRFLHVWPGSPLAERVERACAKPAP